MAVYGDLTFDSRVQREARALAAAGYRVTVYCLAWSGNPATFGMRVDVVTMMPEHGRVVPGTASPFLDMRVTSGRLRRVRLRAAWLVGYVRNLRAWGRMVVDHAGRVDAWHLHDFAGLVAIAPRVTGPIVYDVHDLFTETGTGRHLPDPVRWAAHAYERWLVRRTSLVVAVNAGIADDVERRCRPRTIVVVHNAVPRWTPPVPRPDLIRQHLGLAPDVPVILYHGMLSAMRGIDRLCEAMSEPELEHAHLVLLGYGQLRDRLTQTAAEPRFGGRIHLIDAVPPDQLLPWVASADVGAMTLPAASRNLVLATPNKLFECLAAGTPPVVSDLPLMRRIVMDDPLGPLGDVCDPTDTRSIALAIGRILGQDDAARAALRSRCLAAAGARWNWEAEASRLVAAYAAAVVRRPRARLER
jgi:glycosyltransferase involved in cell wall biosynthesis